MSSIKDILVLHHSHLDLGYTHSQPVMKALQVEYIDQALDLLDRTADRSGISRPKWTCEVTQPVLWWLEQAPLERIDQFKGFLEEGRLAISGLAYNGTPLSDAASFAYQFRGKRYLEERLGIKISTVNIHDVNGISWSIVDMMLDEGIELLTMAVNTHLGRQIDDRPGVFRWSGPSGRSILVMNGAHYTMFDQNLYSWEGSLERMKTGWGEYASFLENKNYPYDFCYLTTTHAPQMWDNAPPNSFVADLIREWNESDFVPPIKYVTPADLLERIRQQDPSTIALKSGDWTDYWIFGAAAAAHATKVNREARRLLFAADLAGALNGRPEQTNKIERNRRSRLALEQIVLYEEHTWGSYNTEISNEQHIAQEHIKVHSAYTARENAFHCLVEELETLAGNQASSDRINSLLLFNPSASRREVYLSVPSGWRKRGRFIRANRFQNENLAADRAGEICGPVTVGPYSYMNLGLDELQPAVSCEELSCTSKEDDVSGSSLNIDFDNTLQSKKSVSTGVFQSGFYVLRFDRESGHILSLKDRLRDREILSGESVGFFEFIRERPDGLIDKSREAFFKRNLEKEKRDISNWREWQAVYEKATEVLSVNVEEHPHELVLSTVFKAPGVRNLTRRISIRSDSALIGIDISFIKEFNENPEGLYFSIPLSLKKGWKAHYDTAAVSTELDVEQLPGSCRGWQCVDNYLSMYEEDFGAALFCPDAPLVMAGGFHFGPPKRNIARDDNPLMLAWPLNNYWDTNFGRVQPGYCRFRYEFMSHGGFNPVETARIADMVRNPVISTASTSSASPEVKLLNCSNDGVTILAVKDIEEDEGLHITLINNSDDETSVSLTVPAGIERAWFSTAGGYIRDALNIERGAVSFRLASRRISFIGLTIQKERNR